MTITLLTETAAHQLAKNKMDIIVRIATDMEELVPPFVAILS